MLYSIVSTLNGERGTGTTKEQPLDVAFTLTTNYIEKVKCEFRIETCLTDWVGTKWRREQQTDCTTTINVITLLIDVLKCRLNYPGASDKAAGSCEFGNTLASCSTVALLKISYYCNRPLIS